MGASVILCVAPSFVIEVGGERIEFEWTYPGPWPLTKKGEPRPLGPRHPFWKHKFWDAVRLWRKQGRRVKNGLCVWKPEPKAKVDLEHLGGRHYRVVPKGKK